MRRIITALLLCFEVGRTIATPSGSGLCPPIVKKIDWGGQPSKNVQYVLMPVEYVIIHHTATPQCNSETDCTRRLVNMQHYHMNDVGYNDISYNFIIGGDGQIYEGVGWHKAGAHSSAVWNGKSIGIAFVGDFRTKLPGPKMLGAAKDLLTCGVELGELSGRYKLLGARSVKSTESPGGALYREIQTWRGFTRNTS